MGVSHRHRDGLVPEKFLDRIEVYSSLDKSCGEGMPKIMKVEILDSHFFQSALEPALRLRTAIGNTSLIYPSP